MHQKEDNNRDMNEAERTIPFAILFETMRIFAENQSQGSVCKSHGQGRHQNLSLKTQNANNKICAGVCIMHKSFRLPNI